MPKKSRPSSKPLRMSTTSADIILALPTDKLVKTLHTLDALKREKLESVTFLSRSITAGGLMNMPTRSQSAPTLSLDVVLRYLRMRGELPDHTDQLFVTDRHDHYLGALYLRDSANQRIPTSKSALIMKYRYRCNACVRTYR